MNHLWVYEFDEKIVQPSFAQPDAHAKHWGQNPKKNETAHYPLLTLFALFNTV